MVPSGGEMIVSRPQFLRAIVTATAWALVSILRFFARSTGIYRTEACLCPFWHMGRGIVT
jgi:ABC-type Na+ efflux pump permease subunit